VYRVDWPGAEIAAQEVNSLLSPVERRQSDGLAWYRFPQVNDEVEHALLTRLGGVSSGSLATLNLGSTVGDDPAAVAENYHRVFSAFDLQREMVVTPFQVHGNRVVRVGPEECGSVIQGTDALITNSP